MSKTSTSTAARHDNGEKLRRSSMKSTHIRTYSETKEIEAAYDTLQTRAREV